jgi:methyl-accepting chemotaxis protein
MKWFLNLRLSAKLISGFIVVAFIAAIVGGIGIVSLKSIDKSDTELYENITIPVGQAGDMSVKFQKVRVDIRDMILASDARTIEASIADVDAKKVEIESDLKAIKVALVDSDDDIKALYETVVNKLDNFSTQATKVVVLARANKDSQAVALMSSTGVSGIASKELQDAIEALVKEQLIHAKEKSDANTSEAAGATTIMIIAIAIGAILAVGLGLFLNKIISTPINILADSADKLALGDVDVYVKSKTKDEIGRLMQSFSNMVENIKYQAAVAQRIAAGDDSVDITPKSDKDVLSNSLKLVINTLGGLVTEVDALTKAAVEGKLDVRGNEDAFQGGYKKIVGGMNKTLDSVIEPIKEASVVLKEMSNGNLSLRVIGDYKGDNAEIKNALNTTIEALSIYINEISDVLGQMANSNLDLVINNDYKGDFVQIKDALNLIILSFNDIFTEINNSADQVASGSRQVSDGSQSLAQGATEQASSVEELTASITQVAAQTKENAINANQANQLALTAKENAEQGNSHMNEMLVSMKEINESSANISKIIKVIDDIAFQTNILALNAAVEAARAGQHGKGFAVVAEEVRNLAARSANAAKETTALIEGSIKKAETGTQIANETAKALVEIVSGVAKAATIVGEIANASNEQATAIAQINKGVEQVSRVVQTNSATAEQSASASEELSSQADLLKDMISRFKLKRTGNQSRYALNDGDYSRMQESSSRKFRNKGFLEAAATSTSSASNNSGYASQERPIATRSKILLSDNEFGKY